jgi:hypothetical protein
MTGAERTPDPRDDERRFLGVPYDFRRPTAQRLKSRWWNAEDARVFTPKSFGWGWDINLRALPAKFRRKP